MTYPKKLLAPLLLLASLIISGQAMAHAMLQKSVPANNATLTEAPKSIEMAFGHEVVLTKLKVIQGESELPIKFDVGTAPRKSYSVPLSQLTPGSYQIKWATMAGDGHAMSGVIKFTISGK